MYSDRSPRDLTNPDYVYLVIWKALKTKMYFEDFPYYIHKRIVTILLLPGMIHSSHEAYNTIICRNQFLMIGNRRKTAF